MAKSVRRSGKSQGVPDNENEDDTGIPSPTRLLKSKNSNELVSFSWNIDAFDCMVASEILIRSQTFKCLQKNQVSEWYLSLEYSPHLPGHLRTGIFLTSVNSKVCPAREVKADVSVFLTDTFGRPTLELGSVNRIFKAKDPALVFRKFLENEAFMAVNEQRSESHEWFTPIGLKQLWGNKDILLSDSTLRLRCFLSVETFEMKTSRSQSLQKAPSPVKSTNTKQLDNPPTTPDVDNAPYRTKTHISEHSIFNDHLVQNSDHSPYGSAAFRSRRPQTANISNARGHDHRTLDLSSKELYRNRNVVTHTSQQRPYTAVDMRRNMSKEPDRKQDCVLKTLLPPQKNAIPQRPKSPYGRRRDPDHIPEDLLKTSKNLALADCNIVNSGRTRNSRNRYADVEIDRPRTRQAYPPPEINSEYERDLDSSNTDCAIICGGRKFNVHTEILKRSSPIFANVLEAVNNEDDSSVPVITTEDVDPAVMRKMLDYVYSGEVDVKQASIFNSNSNPEQHPTKLTIGASRKLLHAAQKYQINNLKEECMDRLITDLSLDTVGEIAVLAHDFNANSQIQSQIKAFLRSKWIVLQRNAEFREVYKRNPEAFVGVFQYNEENTDE